jgi:hypothetical protein
MSSGLVIVVVTRTARQGCSSQRLQAAKLLGEALVADQFYANHLVRKSDGSGI